MSTDNNDQCSMSLIFSSFRILIYQPSRGVYGILQNIECFNCSVDDIVA